MSKKIVKFALDPSNLPPLTAMQQDELAALAEMPDHHTDTSEGLHSTKRFSEN